MLLTLLCVYVPSYILETSLVDDLDNNHSLLYLYKSRVEQLVLNNQINTTIINLIYKKKQETRRTMEYLGMNAEEEIEATCKITELLIFIINRPARNEEDFQEIIILYKEANKFISNMTVKRRNTPCTTC